MPCRAPEAEGTFMVANTTEPDRETTPEEAISHSGLVHVVFKGQRVEFYANPEGLALRRGAAVIVEVERGSDLGLVLLADGPDKRKRKDVEPRRILRLASEEEVERLREIRRSDPQALATVKERVARFKLPMHMVDAEYQFDGHRVTFYFTADHRIDFRELVRDLAAIFRTRIELRQISTREAARRLGGLGTCGRVLCCSCVLCDFERVSLQSAREQKLAMSPTRLSGLCGRLLCCLNFEMDESGPPCPANGAAEECEEARGGCGDRA